MPRFFVIGLQLDRFFIKGLCHVIILLFKIKAAQDIESFGITHVAIDSFKEFLFVITAQLLEAVRCQPIERLMARVFFKTPRQGPQTFLKLAVVKIIFCLVQIFLGRRIVFFLVKKTK
ncbi:hypothetical protein D9M72_480920 [compost metagenome]